jgi:hypothetical protein
MARRSPCVARMTAVEPACGLPAIKHRLRQLRAWELELCPSLAHVAGRQRR